MKKMRKRVLAGGVAALCLAYGIVREFNVAEAMTPRAHAALGYQTWGYQPWWMHDNWSRIDLGLWRRVIFFELQVEANGDVANLVTLPAGWQDMGRSAAACGAAMDLGFTLFDEDKFEKLFVEPHRRQHLLREILALVSTASAKGVHLDFEIYKPVSEQAVRGYRDFLRQLGRELRRGASHRVLSVFGPVGATQDLYDKEALSTVDFVVLQGYDAHWLAGPTAGPVAPLKGPHKFSWEKTLQHYLDLGAQRSRLLFSIPYYGYEWPVESSMPGSRTTGQGEEMTFAPVPSDWLPKIKLSALGQSEQHGLQRDHESGSPYYVYRQGDGGWRQGWFEDEASLTEKIAFIKRENLAGVAAFPLGYDAAKFDRLITRSFGKRPDCRAGGSGAR